jgi:hypothetical protein
MRKSSTDGLQRGLPLSSVYEEIDEPSKPFEAVYEIQRDMLDASETCTKVRETKVINVPEEDLRKSSDRGQFSARKSKRRR